MPKVKMSAMASIRLLAAVIAAMACACTAPKPAPPAAVEFRPIPPVAEARRALGLHLPCDLATLKASAGRDGWEEVHHWMGPPRFPEEVKFDRLLDKQWRLPDGSVQTLEAGIRDGDRVVGIRVSIATRQDGRLLPHTTWHTTPTRRAVPLDSLHMAGFR
ncbi:hypothetical protein [Haloferula sp. BvORR071]|uniref:hypothetical protein n=1 Tax=Haloferula sp. BvORR071 TaxID=1396141 RepID=UPI00055301AD|nr:hypothetical protein [Haloferula sp. BvORR071]